MAETKAAPPKTAAKVPAKKKGTAAPKKIEIKTVYFRWVSDTTKDKEGKPVPGGSQKTGFIADLDKGKLVIQQREKFKEEKPVELVIREILDKKKRDTNVDFAIIKGKIDAADGLFKFESVTNTLVKTDYTVDAKLDILDVDGKVIKADVDIRLPPREADGRWELILGAKDKTIVWDDEVIWAKKDFEPIPWAKFFPGKFKPYGTLTPPCNVYVKGSKDGNRAEYNLRKSGTAVDAFVVHCMSAFYLAPWEPEKWYDPSLNHTIFTEPKYPTSSAHYIIDRAGVLYECVEDVYRAFHVAVGDWNYTAVGAELLGLHDKVRDQFEKDWGGIKEKFEKEIGEMEKEQNDLREKIKTEKDATKKAAMEKRVKELDDGWTEKKGTKTVEKRGIKFKKEWNAKYDKMIADGILKYTDAQYDALINLIKALKTRYDLKVIVGHEEVQAGKFDPGSEFEWDRITKAFPDLKRKR
jgi:hypothetical protein